MKRIVFLVLNLLLGSFAVVAQEIPEVDIRINNSQTSKDDYVLAAYVPCTIRLTENVPPSFPFTSLQVRLQTMLRTHSSAGQVLFALSDGGRPAQR